MDIHLPTSLLGGLSPHVFMRRHWQKKPLLVRQAIADVKPPIDRAGLFALAAREDVESRLIVRNGSSWKLQRGPLQRRRLPALSQADWTLLIQGLDLHLDAAHDLMSQFQFIPHARLDDLMMSYASDGGGVGPHFDSYDVFLLQVQGRRRWRIGRQKDLSLQEDLPLKILNCFEPEEEWVLEPGDMLYLPPRWAHDGVALGECMTCSIGFRSCGAEDMARAVLESMLDQFEPGKGNRRYSDPAQAATGSPARIPSAMTEFAKQAVQRLVSDQQLLARSLGEILSEPKPQAVFDPSDADLPATAWRLDRRSRMLYDDQHVYINGESYVAAGKDARLMRRLADTGRLDGSEVAQLSGGARELFMDWASAGWLRNEGLP